MRALASLYLYIIWIRIGRVPNVTYSGVWPTFGDELFNFRQRDATRTTDKNRFPLPGPGRTWTTMFLHTRNVYL